jgi:APA family basic amino acid/polyamine antiporter
MGSFGARLVGTGLVLSAFGYLCGMILAAPRALFALSRDGILPLSLSNVHEKYHTPWIAIIVQAALSLTVALFMSSFERLAVLANVSVLIVYFGCAAAAWQLRRRDIRDDTSAALISPQGSRFAPPIAMLVILALHTTVTRAERVEAGACLGAGMVLYAISLFPRATRRPAPLVRRP